MSDKEVAPAVEQQKHEADKKSREDAMKLEQFIQHQHDKYPMTYKLAAMSNGQLVLCHASNDDFGLSPTTPFCQSGTIETLFGHVIVETDPKIQLLVKSTCYFSKWMATPVDNSALFYIPGGRIVGMQCNGPNYVETYDLCD